MPFQIRASNPTVVLKNVDVAPAGSSVFAAADSTFTAILEFRDPDNIALELSAPTA